MLKALGLVFKITLFACLILVLGQLIHWRGRSVSDQVKSTLSSAERSSSLKRVKRSSQTLLNDARDAIQEKTREHTFRDDESAKIEKASPGEGSPVSEGIPHDEREELNALLDL